MIISRLYAFTIVMDDMSELRVPFIIEFCGVDTMAVSFHINLGYEVPVQLGDVKYDQPKSVHCHVICSGCGVQPIRGARYKCGSVLQDNQMTIFGYELSRNLSAIDV